MKGTMKHHQPQGSIDDHNNNNNNQSHDLDLLLPPDYNQSHDFDLPPPPYPKPKRAIDPLRLNHVNVLVNECNRTFLTMVTLCTILNVTVFLLTINDVFASKWDTRSAWQLTYLVGPLLQNVCNLVCFFSVRPYGNLHKHGNLLNENGNQENGNQENGNQENGNQENGNQENGNQKNDNQISFWPLWIYSAPMLMIMMTVFSIHAPIAMMLASWAYITINVVFMLTVMIRYYQKNTSQDFDAGLHINIPLGVMAVVLLVMGTMEKSLPAVSLSQSSSSPLASATSAFLGTH